eukprot:4290686-Lingulodinium_polyedra.AAC.1
MRSNRPSAAAAVRESHARALHARVSFLARARAECASVRFPRERASSAQVAPKQHASSSQQHQ